MSALRVQGIVIHLSASRFGTAADIDSWHRANGWSGNGYHRVITNGVQAAGGKYDQRADGAVQPGRAVSRQGAHCAAGGMNRHTLGICCIGTPGWLPAGAQAAPATVTVQPYLTRLQHASLITSLTEWCAAYGLDPMGSFVTAGGLTKKVISQHSDHDPRKPLCASLRLDPIRRAVRDTLRTWRAA